MLSKNRVIVLSKLKYRDYDLIVKCYTYNRGTVSYILRGVLKNKKGNSKVAYFQMLSQLQIDEDYKPNHSLQTIKDIKVEHPYESLHTNVLKGSIVMFLAEVLSTSLREEEPNEALYDYLENSLLLLDHETQFSNFHLLFLLQLTRHLGFYPDVSNSSKPYFNLSNGLFESHNDGVYSISDENLSILKQLLNTNFEGLSNVKLNSKQRQSFLNMLLLYYELHLGDFRKPKSLSVFNQVFS
ncbi:DNA repair protein RecO [Mangrovimonas sp. DI 80]|uniref:DNA repair protein RecO n=1 Tax=Mangrovimonas sp. DI 80 TaxID=1779330 RepID=UPI000978C840|nr:DNA repair protein RecO [Mangrovimonas sp. DI 80]OMP32514.1 DNA repair protein RecO [Mangrovimonas sp. DI 80]